MLMKDTHLNISYVLSFSSLVPACNKLLLSFEGHLINYQLKSSIDYHIISHYFFFLWIEKEERNKRKKERKDQNIKF